MEILSGFFLVVFWAAVLAFVPSIFYLLIINPPLYYAKDTMARGIYVLREEATLRQGKKVRARQVGLIYGACFFLVGAAYLVNRNGGVLGSVVPFDILSSISILAFWFSVLTYLPVAVYVFLQDPWRHHREKVCLGRMFIGYGISILIFCCFFAAAWLQGHHVLVKYRDIAGALFVLLWGGAGLSYLPILCYIFIVKAFHPFRLAALHPNVIFVIYSVCFLCFTAIYVANWFLNWRQGSSAIFW